jgi:hypothetical protein
MPLSEATREKWSKHAVLLSYLLVGGAALLLCALNLGTFITGDESDFWIKRSGIFLNALRQGDFAATAITTHPGVTTMWLGAAGIVLRDQLFDRGILHTETMSTLLTLYRLPAALVHVAGTLGGYALLRRMFSPTLALLAALLWATDPFTLAFERVLHVDALSGTFATLSLLAACAAWNHPPREQRTPWLLLALSGGSGALAVLSKSPGLVVVPIVGLLALRAWSIEKEARNIGHATRHLLLWGTFFALTIAIFWPAVWAAPGQVYDVLRVGVAVEGGSPHMTGNFFLGQAVDAPGPLFYPVALALRTTPWALVGLLLLPFAAWPYRGERALPTLRTLAALAGLVLLFVVGLSFFPKKFNRYLVPAFPAVNILAAVGIAWGIAQLARLARLAEKTRQWTQRALLGVVALAALLNAAWFHPYSITYFNQLLGGTQAGPRAFVVGWGEGYGQVAAWLNQQPDITGVVTVAKWGSSLNPFLRKGAFSTSPDGEKLPGSAGYVVVYIRHVLSGPPSPPFDRFYERVPPLHTVTIHGVDYAWIYHVPREMAHPLESRFGPAIRLSGYDLQSTAVHSSGVLTLTAQWQAQESITNDYTLFVHLLDSEGQRVSQIDLPPGGSERPTNTWETGRYIVQSYPLPFPPDAPAGNYWLALGLYNPRNMTRLLLQGSTPPPAAPASHEAGNNTLLLGPITLPPPGSAP